MVALITPLPPAPLRTDPATFAARADAMVGALPNLVNQINAVALATIGSGNFTNINATGAATFATALGIASGGTGRNALIQSLGNNGYVNLPGGFILQWFSTGSAGSGVNGSVSFPITFPSACYTVFTQMANTGGDDAVGDSYVAQIRTISASGFTIRNLGPAARVFFCIAVGS